MNSRLNRIILSLLVTLNVIIASFGGTMRPVVRGQHYAVSSMRPVASLVAERILASGGNAFDAAVAAQAVLGVTDAHMNGIGGDAMILAYKNSTGEAISLNAQGTAPALATIDWYEENMGGVIPDSETLLSGTIPGVVDAWYILLDRWGTMSFEKVLAPAIELAENGFPISERLAGAIANSKKLRKYPTSVATYYPGGEAPSPGSIFRNPQLALTMKKLVEAEKASQHRGRSEALKAARDRFYKGDLAQTMAEFSEKNDGLFRYEDFAGYSAIVEEPISINYRGYDLYKNPSANQGPAELIALKLLEGFNLKEMGHNSVAYIHTGIEAIKLAFADREKYLADANFVEIPYEGLLSNEYARQRRALIDRDRASLDFRPGTAEDFVEGMERLDRPINVNFAAEDSGSDGDTSYVCVVDKERNVVSFTPSLHNGFGTNVVMADLGFSFNCRGDYFSLTRGHPNALEPGKRPRSTLTSTLVLKNDKPAMVLGSPGGDDQCMRTLQTFLNIVEFGMNIQEAIEAPRWSTRSFPLSFFPHVMHAGDASVENRIGKTIQEALRAKGHRLEIKDGWSLGMNAGIVIDQQTGVVSAGADPRVDAYAVAW